MSHIQPNQTFLVRNLFKERVHKRTPHKFHFRVRKLALNVIVALEEHL